MANTDPISKLPIRTIGLTDVQIQIADPTTPTQQAAVDSHGSMQFTVRDSGGVAAAIAAASTAAAATDAGLVVALSPNSPLPVGDNIVGRLKITDGTNVAAVKAASAAAIATDPSLVVALSPNSPLPTGGNLIGRIELDDGAGNAITSTTINSKQRLDVNLASSGVSGSAVPFQTTQVGGSDGTNLRALKTDATGVLAANVYSGGNPNSSTNPIFVTVGNTTPGTPVNYYNATASTVAPAGSDNTSTYTITTGKTLSLKKAFVGASVHMRCDLQISANGTVWTTIASMFIPYGGGNASFDYDEVSVQESGTGSGVRVVFNNEDTQAATGYVSLCGVEN
jgi:hypothetical protein